VTGLVDLAGLNDRILFLGVVWGGFWCAGLNGIDLRGGGWGVGDMVPVSVSSSVQLLLPSFCAVASSEAGARSHCSFGPFVKVFSDLVELALLSWLLVLW